jgi:glycosyltransferase involved in cell wall biosynthesis
MKLSIVIPCYNEARTIRIIVDRVRAAPVADKEIIIVDDCSRDGTRDLLRTEIAPLVDQVIYHANNQGKGAALRTGFAAGHFGGGGPGGEFLPDQVRAFRAEHRPG